MEDERKQLTDSINIFKVSSANNEIELKKKDDQIKSLNTQIGN